MMYGNGNQLTQPTGNADTLEKYNPAVTTEIGKCCQPRRHAPTNLINRLYGFIDSRYSDGTARGRIRELASSAVGRATECGNTTHTGYNLTIRIMTDIMQNIVIVIQ
ncbi:hypothetical protein KGM_204612 [Danaus plexippus plexippus]|uniref:Uncharacterized protein n=1 Tax=Danaus plexippus plexippus TaxID=278856 RepID=A0A212F5Q7_DANPL|nr:hypothetical protein KGM_204612 [Danaus plexippus plexippus]